jgi:hypothetical protein
MHFRDSRGIMEAFKGGTCMLNVKGSTSMVDVNQPTDILELNGISNLHLLLDQARPDMPTNAHNSMKEQLDLLERYIIEVDTAAKEGRKHAFWHDVIANPSAYPNRKEALGA